MTSTHDNYIGTAFRNETMKLRLKTRRERRAGLESARLRRLRTTPDRQGWTRPFAGATPNEWWSFNNSLGVAPAFPNGWVRKLATETVYTAGVYLTDPHAIIDAFPTLRAAKEWVMNACLEQALR